MSESMLPHERTKISAPPTREELKELTDDELDALRGWLSTEKIKTRANLDFAADMGTSFRRELARDYSNVKQTFVAVCSEIASRRPESCRRCYAIYGVVAEHFGPELAAVIDAQALRKQDKL